MGGFLDKPKTEKNGESGNGNGLRYGLSCMQGWRIEMEDSHTALTALQDLHLKKWSFFGVFDGHAGARVSAHCSEHLLPSILQEEKFKSEIVDQSEDISAIKEAMRTGFLKLDARMREIPELASGEDKSGTTAVCSLISPNFVYVANCGDSRSVLYTSEGLGFKTEDHKPVNTAEKERILKAGGTVMISRVNGSLAVSRALGDYEYKSVEGIGQCEQLVSPEPELYVHPRSPSDQFLILACDGIWDVMSNESLGDYVRSRFLLSDDIQHITNQVLDTCFNLQSRDNMSIVIVAFPNAPKICPVAVEKERRLDDLILRRVTELCARSPPPNLTGVFEALQEEELPDLPPGGRFPSKIALIESHFLKLRPECQEDPPGVVEEVVIEASLSPMMQRALEAELSLGMNKTKLV